MGRARSRDRRKAAVLAWANCREPDLVLLGPVRLGSDGGRKRSTDVGSGWCRLAQSRSGVGDQPALTWKRTLQVAIIEQVLLKAGVEFIDENGDGPGVRLRKRQRAKQLK